MLVLETRKNTYVVEPDAMGDIHIKKEKGGADIPDMAAFIQEQGGKYAIIFKCESFAGTLSEYKRKKEKVK